MASVTAGIEPEMTALARSHPGCTPVDTPVDDVIAVDLTVDGILVIADRLNLSDFPPALGIRINIPQLDLRDIVWAEVARDLASQGVLDRTGAPHPEVAAMVDTSSRADRTLECRWWRRDVGGKMVRFTVCRRGGRHVIAARDGDTVVLQQVAPRIGLAGMVLAVLGAAPPADVEPFTAAASELAQLRMPDGLARLGVGAISARRYSEITAAPSGWVEVTASERHPGGTHSRAEVAAGVLDSSRGRIVSIPRRVNGELYGSFLSGTPDNLQRALDGLVEFLPSKTWFENDTAGSDAADPD